MTQVTARELRDRIHEFESEIRKLPPVDCPIKHHFSEGIYAREMFIPKGTVVTGKIHKYENLNIMSKGKLSIRTESGVITVEAPFTVVSPPGTKRIAYAHEDSIWTTIHATSERDVKIIEQYFVAQNEEEYLEFCKQLELKECA